MVNVDCFAYRERGKYSGCKVFKEINCKNCKFYRSNINESEIERDIREYAIKYNK